jgi:hypothetical protein
VAPCESYSAVLKPVAIIPGVAQVLGRVDDTFELSGMGVPHSYSDTIRTLHYCCKKWKLELVGSIAKRKRKILGELEVVRPSQASCSDWV